MISRGGKKEKEKRWISSTLLLLFFLLVFLCNVASARRKDRQVCFVEIEKYNERENREEEIKEIVVIFHRDRLSNNFKIARIIGYRFPRGILSHMKYTSGKWASHGLQQLRLYCEFVALLDLL